MDLAYISYTLNHQILEAPNEAARQHEVNDQFYQGTLQQFRWHMTICIGLIEGQ